MNVVFDDGGRQTAGYKGTTSDCVVRAITIAIERPYQEVYSALNGIAEKERPRQGTRSNARTGVRKATIHRYLKNLGWTWKPTMFIGSGCRVHLMDGELPLGRLIVQCSKHLCAVIDNVIHDIYDPQRETIIFENGSKRIAKRCVYGYWFKPSGAA